MDTAAHWPQDIVVKPMEEIVVNSCTTTPKPSNSSSSVERKVRPQKEQALNCPRCNSTNTKFCYYNNYSLSQPRYFCKTCRRYWTEGGSLRSIPVGGGSRKNKRSSSSAASNPLISKKLMPDLVPPQQNPNKILESPADLNLGFSSTTTHHDFKAITEMIQVPNYHENMNTKLELQNYPSSSLSRGLSSFLVPSHDPNTVYSNNSSSLGFPSLLPDFKLCNFSLDGLGNNTNTATATYGSFHHQGGVHEPANGKLLFPFEDLKQVSSNNTNHHDDAHDQQNRDPTTGYWNGVIGTGGSW